MASVETTQTISIIHYPRLDTVLSVEKFIKKHSGEFTKTQLWKKLPKKIMYQTFNFILSYLEDSGKIAYDTERKIAWVYNPKLVKKFLKQGVEV